MDKAESTKTLIALLKDKDPVVRAKAAHALGNRKAVEAIPALIRMLFKEPFDNKDGAVSALGRMGEPAVKALLQVFDSNFIECEFAALALGDIGLPAVPSLIERLTSPDKDLSSRSATALENAAMFCPNIAELDAIEKIIERAIREMAQKDAGKKSTKSAKVVLAKARMRVADRRNRLATRRDIILDDIPKPPKKEEAYQLIRRTVGNG
jgi:HEAT repeat protein